MKAPTLAYMLLVLSGFAAASAQRRLGPSLGLGLGLGQGGRQNLTAGEREYERLEPLAKYVNVKGMWKSSGLPDPPKVLCHVGVLGWHCHNTTLHPWDPRSILPADAAPPMPANATCIICPPKWGGPRSSMLDVLADLPKYAVSRDGKLPPGMWDGEKLMEAAKAASRAAPGAQGTVGQ